MGGLSNVDGGAVWRYLQLRRAAGLKEIATAVGLGTRDARRLLDQLAHQSMGNDQWIEYDDEDDVYYYHELR
jgi:DNA-binding IclR family transcriptional regulator